jgi:hypothetical protein
MLDMGEGGGVGKGGEMKKKLNKSFLISDSAIPALFFLATGKRYSNKERCVNDYRRFFEVCLLYCVGRNIPKGHWTHLHEEVKCQAKKS